MSRLFSGCLDDGSGVFQISPNLASTLNYVEIIRYLPMSKTFEKSVFVSYLTHFLPGANILTIIFKTLLVLTFFPHQDIQKNCTSLARHFLASSFMLGKLWCKSTIQKLLSNKTIYKDYAYEWYAILRVWGTVLGEWTNFFQCIMISSKQSIIFTSFLPFSNLEIKLVKLTTK